MTLPALADTDALADLLGVSLAGADLTRAQAVLANASALIRAEAGVDFLDPDDEEALDPDLADIIVTVCLASAERAFRNPEGLRAESLGSYSATFAGPAQSMIGVYLLPNERRLIRQAAGIRSVTSHMVEGVYDVALDSSYYATMGDGTGDDMPWVTLGDD